MNVDLKDIPPYVHDGFVVRHRDEYSLIHPLLKQNGFCIVENVLSPKHCTFVLIFFIIMTTQNMLH